MDPATGLIDFDELRKRAKLFRPKMIICGTSAYPRTLDFAKFREIADEVGALLHADIAHISTRFFHQIWNTAIKVFISGNFELNVDKKFKRKNKY